MSTLGVCKVHPHPKPPTSGQAATVAGDADVSSAGVERPRGADWGDRVGDLKGVACGHSWAADGDVGVPRGARATSGGDGGPGSADVIVGRCERTDSHPVPWGVRRRDRVQRPRRGKRQSRGSQRARP